MAGYTRQSVADIINGADITAPPVNAEFNQLASAFNGSTGHSHDGSTGNAPKINLTTSVSGYLPAVHGGVGGKNNLAATTNPTTTDDAGDGYAPGSLWENTTTGRIFICVGNTANAAVWRELVQVETGNVIKPITHDTIDLGTPAVRFQDLWLSGGIGAAGNVSVGGTLSVTGATTFTGLATANGGLTVNGTSLLTGNVTIGDSFSATDTVAFAAGVSSHIVPFTDNLVDLGSASTEWRNLYIDGTANVDTLQVDENATVTGNTTLTGTLDVTGDATVANLSATGTTTITSGDINSGAMDNTTIGSATPAAGTFTTLNANTSLTAATADINGGTIDGTSVGATTPSTGAFTSLSAAGTSTLATVDINGGAIDGTTIGATSHTTGKFTTLQSTGQATLDSVNIDGGAIDGTTVGASVPSTGAFTTLSASGGITGDLTGDVVGNVTGNLSGNVTGNTTGNLTGNVTASSGTSTFNNVTINGGLDMNAGTTATITNLTDPTNAQDAATRNYVDTSIANLVDSAPGTLDTLNELAAALGDDPNFSTTITNSIATKLPLAGGTMTGAIAMGTSKITGLGDPTAAQDAATKNYVDTQDALQVTKTGDSMSGNLAMGSNNITGLATPTANDHATNKSYVDGILGSATAASASAAAAATSEANAATSETNAANSATSAASDLASVQSIYDQFDDRYLGSKASAPTVDNDGNALLTGALYFNTTTNLMYVYGSSGWVTAGSAVNGTTDRVTYTATAGQTVFAATYDTGYVDVYMNGVKLLAGTDFTATNGTSITLTSGAAVNDVIDIVAYGTFTLADHYTKTEADNRYVNVAGDTMTGDLILPAGGKIKYNDDRYFTPENNVDGAEVSANGVFKVKTGATPATRFLVGGGGDISFYDTSGNAKFFWDASAERLGIGVGTSPDAAMHVGEASYPQIRTVYNGIDSWDMGVTSGSIFKLGKANAADSASLFQTDSGQVGIGVTPSAWGSNNTALQIRSVGFVQQDIATNVGLGRNAVQAGPWSYIANGHAQMLNLESDGAFKFFQASSGTAGNTISFTQAMTLDASGNLLVGHTDRNTTVSNGASGATIGYDGFIGSSRLGSLGEVMVLNREDSDGSIMSFRKDGTTVGSIGTKTGRIHIGSGDTALYFNEGTDAIQPVTSAGVTRNGAIDLGDQYHRFKDLYLSGGVYLGGTGSANKLTRIYEFVGTLDASGNANLSYPTGFVRDDTHVVSAKVKASNGVWRNGYNGDVPLMYLGSNVSISAGSGFANLPYRIVIADIS